MHLTFFQRKRQADNDIDIVMGENNISDKFIVMDDVSGVADKFDDFANFLTVSRKFNFTRVYVFHTMYPTRSSWQMILSQTKNFKYFSRIITDIFCNKNSVFLLQQVYLQIYSSQRPLAEQTLL